MFNNFAPDANHGNNGGLIPAGALHFAVLKVRSIKASQETNGTYADLEITLVEGPFEGRKVWPMISNPADPRNKEGGRQIGMGALQHILECMGHFDHTKPETYQKFANASFEDILAIIDGSRAAVKIGIEKGTNGYNDKNKVVEWLSPNPASATHKAFLKLCNGDHGVEKKSGDHPASNGSTFSLGQSPVANTQQVTTQAAGIVTGQKPAFLGG